MACPARSLVAARRELCRRATRRLAARMIPFSFGSRGTQLRDILCLGAHSDDIEIGCGATILGLLAAHPGARVTWVVFSGNAVREAEARRAAARFLGGARASEIYTRRQRDGFFPAEVTEI